MLTGDLVEVPHPAEDQIPGVQTLRRLAPSARAFRLHHPRLDRRDHVPDDLVLQREQFREVAVVALGPEVMAGLGLDELSGHPDAVPRAPGAALEHVADAELAADLLHRHRRCPCR